MKLTEQPGITVRQEEWDDLAARLVRIGYGVQIGKEKIEGASKYRKTIYLVGPEEFPRGDAP